MKRLLCTLLVSVLMLSSLSLQVDAEMKTDLSKQVFIEETMISSNAVTNHRNETIIYNFLTTELGCNKATAVGILANIERECGYNENLSHYNKDGELTRYGIFQWGGGRLTDLKDYCSKNGYSYKTLTGQLYFMKYELETSEKKAWKKMQGIENTKEGAYTAGYRWGQYYERCWDVYCEESAIRARDVYWPKYNAVSVQETKYDIERIWGASRYKTSLAIADELKALLGMDEFDTVIIASGDNFPDALAGSFLATKMGAPILMVNDNSKNIALIKTYVEQNLMAGGKVYILGGSVAVPETMEADLSKKGYVVERLSGSDRYATNLAILNEAGITNEALLVCTGNDFADSLSASATGLPILLVDEKTKTLTKEQKAFLEKGKREIYIIGGTSAVSESYATALKAYDVDQTVKRIKGSSRYETSVKVAEVFCENPDTVVLASAVEFPDGLCGGTLAYFYAAPLILTTPTTNVKNTAPAKEYSATKELTLGIALGGTGALEDAVVRTVFGMSENHKIAGIKYE